MHSRQLSGAMIVVFALFLGGIDLASRNEAAATPELLGFSSERLARIDAVMQEAVDTGRLAGVVTAVARYGQIAHLKAYGMRDREQGVPMTTDTIIRIASMTKTPTSIAAMMLMEEGRLAVTDPVSKYIPAFRETTVAVPPPPGSPPGTTYTVEPAKREIRVHDLLTKTAGMGYPPAYLRATYEPLDLHSFYFADKAEPMSAVVGRLPTVPFTAHPGEDYQNGFATDVLGVVIEKASGMGLDEFFRTRIFQPLKMTDTSFFLPKEKTPRLAAVYTATRGGPVKRADGRWGRGQGDYVEGPRLAFSGGGGLLSTARDYGRLLQMMLNGGELDGVRLLGPKTIEMMTTNHVGTMYQHPGIGELGFGYGFELTLNVGRAHHTGSPGDFGYRSAYFSRYFADPEEQLYAIFLAQLTNYGGTSDLHTKFRTLVYQALVGPGTAASQDGGAP